MEKFIIDHKRLSEVLPMVGAGGSDYPHVVLLMGGMSPEREISLMSGKVVMDALSKMNYRVTPIDMGGDISEVIRKLNPDVVFNALHGTFGEDGCVPGILETLGIPYTHSGVLASSIALDKILSQKIFIASGVKCPKRVVVSKNDDLSKEPIARPFIIKPVDQGSSLGVEVVFAEDDYDLSQYDFAYGDRAIIEEYIVGQEIQVAVLDNKAIGTLEIVPLKGSRFNDYDCKYKEGYAKHVCPAEIPKAASDNILAIAEKVHKLIGCKGVTRSEFRYNADADQAYFIEINTHPGLTLLSSAPDIIQRNGISFKKFIENLITEVL
jgi:D-alanine-D-alanine ligase